MRIDLYTKCVLTVIAACLVWMCVSGVTPAAYAQAARPQPTPVVIVDFKGQPLQTLPVSVLNRAIPVVVANPQAIPVSMESTVGVTIRSVERGGAWDPFDVRIMREAPTLQPIP
jgi:hypothetical protein